MTSAHIPRVLSIAGSDSGGGAGIQADLKAFAACGVHGMTAITAITAQNTLGVTAVHQVPPEVIVAQVRAVQEDIGIDAVKIGMLGNVSAIEAVASSLEPLSSELPVVLDPVMVAESGAQLLEPSARRRLIELLLPRATVITPNLPEAYELVAEGGAEPSLDPAELAPPIKELGPAVVVITGGHSEAAVDVFFDGVRLEQLAGEHHVDASAHGSGCTHSSVLAARLAWGDDPLEAARVAKTLSSRAVRDSLQGLGEGAGPVDVLALRTRVPAGGRHG